MKRYDAVLFDLDGTLVDSFAFHSKVIQGFLKTRGYCPPLEQIEKNIGNTIKSVLDGCGVPAAAQQPLIQGLDEYYINSAKDLIGGIHLEKGARELLQRMKEQNIKAGVLTNSKHVLAEMIIRKNGVQQFFVVVDGATDRSLDKQTRCPKILVKLSVAANRCLYVGDTRYDMELARECGMDVCIIRSRIGWEADYDAFIRTHAPEYVATGFEDVAEIILGE